MESSGSKSLVFFGQPAYIFYVPFNHFRAVKIPGKRVFDPAHGYLRRVRARGINAIPRDWIERLALCELISEKATALFDFSNA